MRSAGSTRPVGLFGEVRKTTWGRSSSTTRRISLGSSVKSALRSPSTTRDPTTRAIWACIWYVGSNVATVRPAPAYASRIDCNTSFDPLATNTMSAVTPCVPAVAMPRSDRLSELAGAAIGIAMPFDARQLGGERVAPRHGGRQRRLVGVEPHTDVDLRRVVALEGAQVVADRDHARGGYRAIVARLE